MTRNLFWSVVNIMKEATQSKTTREAILDATDLLLARYGYKKMSIQDLADEVGIGKGTIYLHFTSKEEIALSQIDRMIERLKQQLSDIASGKGTASAKLTKMLVLRVVYRCQSVHHYSYGINDLLAQLRTQLLERRRRYFEEEAMLLAGVVAEGQSNGEFAAGNELVLARALVTATNSLLPYSLSAYELGDLKTIERETKTVADLLIRGLKK